MTFEASTRNWAFLKQCNYGAFTIESLRTYGRLLQRKRRIKIELSAKCLIREYSMLVIYEIGEVYFRLLGTNGFHAKAENERLTASAWHYRPNLKYENFTSSFARVIQRIAPKSVFFPIQPCIKSLICGLVVAVAVAVVISSETRSGDGNDHDNATNQ